MLVENYVGLLFLQTMIMVKLLNAVMFTWLLFIGCVVSKEITCQPQIGISTMEVMCANLCTSKIKIEKLLLAGFCVSATTWDILN